MKNSAPNADKNTEHDYNNEYEFKIKSFATKNRYNLFDDKVIQYAISLKNEIIASLENNSSKSDKIKVKHVTRIEKYLLLFICNISYFWKCKSNTNNLCFI